MKVFFTEQEQLSHGALRVFAQGNVLFLTEDGSLGAEVELSACWAVEGGFVFLGCCTPEEGVDWFVARGVRSFARFSWLESAVGPYWEMEVSDGAVLFGSRDFRLVILGGASITCQEDSLSFSWSADLSPAALLVRGTTLRTAPKVSVRLGMNGQEPAAGVFQFDLSVEPQGKNLFEQLGVGMHFSTELAKVSRRAALRAGFLGHLYSTVFSCKEPITLGCRICPAAWLDPQRTCLTLPEGLAMQSRFCTPEGLYLQAKTRSGAALVLEREAVVRHGKNEAVHRYSLGFCGSFALSSSSGGAPHVLCGLSGTEYLSFAAREAVVEFVPGQSASLCSAKADPWGDTVAYLRPAGSAAYHSQAVSAPFYWPDKEGRFVLAPLALCKFGEEGAPTLPFFLYTEGRLFPEHGSDPATVEHRLSASRLTVLAARDNEVSGSVRTALSPLGLLAGLCGGEDAPELSWVAFGNTMGVPAEQPSLRLEGVSLPLRARLLGVRPSGYYESADALMADARINSDSFRYEVCGWKLLLAPQFWGGDRAAAMLFQYGTGETLRQTYGERAVLQNILSCTMDQNGMSRSAYEPLLRVLDDPAFQGVVFLNCAVQVDRTAAGFCPEWSLLLNSIDESQLRAEYCIVYQSSCILQDGTLRMGPSQMEALVDYQRTADSDWNETASTVKFRTIGLRLTLRNGAVQSLESESELLLGELFGSSCHKIGNRDGVSLLLNGVFSGGVQRYTLQQPGVLSLADSALEKVSIESVLCSVSVAKTCFTLGGRLYFRQAAEGDVFSYGMDESGNDCGLRFEGMNLYQNVDGTITPSWNEITLRPADSTPRPGSLSLRFPVNLAGFRFGTAGNMPADQGFFSIRAPLQQGALTGQWFGLEYRLDLGNLGTLGADSGLAIRLLFAWAPGPIYYAGANLGAVQWELLGVFSCGFASVGLDVDLSANPPSYSMTLEQFALRLLGAKIPPGSNTLCLFAGEDGRRLGWYAVYQEEKEGGTQGDERTR